MAYATAGNTPFKQPQPSTNAKQTDFGYSGYGYNAADQSWYHLPTENQTTPYDKALMHLKQTGGGFGGMGAGTNSGGSYGNPAQVAGPSGAATIGGGQAPDRIGDAGIPGNVGKIQGPDTSGANAALFARAKDQVGQTARSALTGLAGAMAGRGTVGSGVEGRGMSSIINQGQGQLGETSRELAIQDAQMAEQNALAQFQGDISQRGQTIGSLDTRRGQDVTQRGQDISHLDNANNSLVTQRGQDLALQGLQYQGGITQRGQDMSANESQRSRQQAILEALMKGGMY